MTRAGEKDEEDLQRCFHCIRRFDGEPARRPVRFDPRSKTLKVAPEPFCCTACVMAYMKACPMHATSDALQLLTLTRQNLHAEPAGQLYAEAPPRSRLACFGGAMTRAEYDATLAELRGGSGASAPLATEVVSSSPSAPPPIRAAASASASTSAAQAGRRLVRDVEPRAHMRCVSLIDLLDG